MATSSNFADAVPSPNDAEMSKPAPMMVAGSGGQTSAAANKSIQSFSPSVMQHLVAIYKSIPKDQPYQDAAEPITNEASFLNYMSTTDSSAMAPPRTRDLSHPMSSYYISSSHNTYLSGNQLYGDASTEAYSNVLKRGCRCLEIDVWDGEHSDSDSSDDSTDDERSTEPHEHERHNSKPSRWDRMKAKAAHIHSRSHPDHDRGLAEKAEAAAKSPVDDARLPQMMSGTHLSPQPLPALPSKAEPRVLHGHTLTQSVTFRAVCHAIRQSAFVSTSLPIIVSLEIHASLSQQEAMVEIMREIWSDHLIDVSQVSESTKLALPAPDTLRNKILIKVKWTPNSRTGESNDPLDHVTSNSTQGGSEDKVHTTSAKQKKASKILAALSELGVYTRAYSFKHFSQPEASIPTHVFSLSEGKVRDLHADPHHGPALFEHNKNFLMRVFPRGTRIRSTNIDPTFHWRQGAQMVALNWQRLDRGMMLNEAMFAGQDGWVLKPAGYRVERPSSAAGPGSMMEKSTMTMPQKRLLDLHIELLAAQDLPLPPNKDASYAARLRPYINFQLHVDSDGPPGQGTTNVPRDESEDYDDDDRKSSKYKRRSKTLRSDAPDFGHEMVSWTRITDVVDELSFLRLKVNDDRSLAKDDLIAWACIRLDRLQSGYRFIHLLDTKGAASTGVLLVKIVKSLS